MKRLLILAQRAGRTMRSPTASVYLLAFVYSAILTALFPLVPAFEDEFSLSKLQIGVLLAAGGWAFLLVAIPIGILADRVGARSITIVTAGVLVVAALGQALGSPDPPWPASSKMSMEGRCHSWPGCAWRSALWSLSS